MLATCPILNVPTGELADVAIDTAPAFLPVTVATVELNTLDDLIAFGPIAVKNERLNPVISSEMLFSDFCFHSRSVLLRIWESIFI